MGYANLGQEDASSAPTAVPNASRRRSAWLRKRAPSMFSRSRMGEYADAAPRYDRARPSAALGPSSRPAPGSPRTRRAPLKASGRSRRTASARFSARPVSLPLCARFRLPARKEAGSPAGSVAVIWESTLSGTAPMRSWTELRSESSSVSAIPARTGLRSTYAIAASNAWLLKRPSRSGPSLRPRHLPAGQCARSASA
jgi:hypothetical protein